MNKLLYILFLLSFGITSAHTNVIFEKSYGNVNLISSTPYYTEDINKNIITAKYAELLLKELDYKETIHLWLWPDRTVTFKAYFGNGEGEHKGLNIFITEKETDISKTLNLIENVILNLKSLDTKRDQFKLWYHSTQSKLIGAVLLNKIYRPKDVPELLTREFFDYYYQNGTYYILSSQNYEVIEVAQLKKVLQFSNPIPSLLFVFTESNSLTVIKADYKYDGTKYNATAESVKFDFEPESEYSFRPYTFRLLGQKFITIESIFGDKVSLYNIKKKKLTQDLVRKLEE
jgi:hypothetical protein